MVFADCDMAAMMAKTGYSISNLGPNPGPGAYDDPDEFIGFLKSNSTYSTNPDGYGVTYIDGDGNFPNINTLFPSLPEEVISSQAWYVTADDLGDEFYYLTNPDPMDAAETAIENNNNDISIVLGHDRKSGTAFGNHPFRFTYDANTTFQFIHNGGIDDGDNEIKEALYDALGGASWFALNGDHPSNWNYDFDDWEDFIDSEILFHWIMSNIIDCNGDIVTGIQKALTATVPIQGGSINLEEEFREPYGDWHNVVNFVLTDGEKLYLFRNAKDTWSHHYLSWQENTNNSYTVKTQTVLDNALDQFDFVILSRDDDPVVYHDFFDFDKQFSAGVNWVSFPRLTEQGTYPILNGESFEQAYYENTLPGLLQVTSSSLGSIDGFENILGNRNGSISIIPVGDDFAGNDEGFDNMLFRHEGYKVTIDTGADPTTLVVDGDRLLDTYTISEALPAYTENWIGYWLPESRNIVDAFGEFWEYVEEIWSEDWYYNKCSNNRGLRGAEPISWSSSGKILEYGKSYIVQFERILEIEDFCWTPSSTTEEPTKKTESENFAYIEKPDYEVIDVVDIPGSVAEIGVFQDDVCVGAVVVENECEQILVYSESANREEISFTFEIATNSRGITLPIKNYLVLNMNSGEFEKGNLISGHQISSVVKFGDIGEPQIETPIIAAFELHGNYPNPFNPTTQISFSLPTAEAIELLIYNVKGQKVKTLYSGFSEEGDHSLIWEGKDEEGKSVSSGIYFYKLKTSTKELTRKMLMMK